jgi:hypothetical protein
MQSRGVFREHVSTSCTALKQSLLCAWPRYPRCFRPPQWLEDALCWMQRRRVWGLVLRLRDAGPPADLAALRLDGVEHDDHYSWFLVVLAHQSQQTPIRAAHPLLAVATSLTIVFAPRCVACFCRLPRIVWSSPIHPCQHFRLSDIITTTTPALPSADTCNFFAMLR